MAELIGILLGFVVVAIGLPLVKRLIDRRHEAWLKKNELDDESMAKKELMIAKFQMDQLRRTSAMKEAEMQYDIDGDVEALLEKMDAWAPKRLRNDTT